MNGREQRGIEIAQRGGIEKGMKGWAVPAQSKNGYYTVQLGGGGNCNCPDRQTRGVKCKHQWAVQYFQKIEKDKEGNTTVTQTKRVTYKQDWKAHRKAQINEIALFDNLLKDLVNSVGDKDQKMGRPRASDKDLSFCAIQKVYSQLSSRRAYTLYRNANGKEQITKPPSYNMINIFLNRKEITPILQKLLNLSALPLKSVETAFAIDSTGFSTSKFGQYCVEKHKTKRQHMWVKCHALVGTKTNIIVSANVTEENAGDCPQFRPLVTEAHENGFNIQELTGDKAYSSRDNHNLANEIGATAYIPFRSNATGTSRGSLTWSKMFHYFQLHREEFLEHYHKRSNVETAFQMVKAKFGEKLKSKNETAQQNELLCKLICHNVCCVIQEMHELGVKPDFTVL